MHLQSISRIHRLASRLRLVQWLGDGRDLGAPLRQRMLARFQVDVQAITHKLLVVFVVSDRIQYDHPAESGCIQPFLPRSIARAALVRIFRSRYSFMLTMWSSSD